MNKIEEVRQLLETWKAARTEAYKQGQKNFAFVCKGAVEALEAALTKLDQPSNTKLQVDACECDEPEAYQVTAYECNLCGLPLRAHD